MGNLITPFREVYDFSQPLYMVMGNYIIQEEWKPLWLVIPNIKYGYFVSNFGRVYSVYSDSFIYTVKNNGYVGLKCRLNNNKRIHLLVHRLVAELFIPNIDPINQNIINHKDGNKQNNFYMNLEWCTQKHNINHAFDIGLSIPIKGESHYNSKYTEKQVHMICEALENNMSYKDICNKVLNIEYCDHPIISGIRNGHYWKHISCLYDFEGKRKNNQLFTDDELKKIYQYMLDGFDNRYIMDNVLNIPKGTQCRRNVTSLLSRLRKGANYHHINNGIDLTKQGVI